MCNFHLVPLNSQKSNETTSAYQTMHAKDTSSAYGLTPMQKNHLSLIKLKYTCHMSASASAALLGACLALVFQALFAAAPLHCDLLQIMRISLANRRGCIEDVLTSDTS
jgi:hypothetical protein